MLTIQRQHVQIESGLAYSILLTAARLGLFSAKACAETNQAAAEQSMPARSVAPSMRSHMGEELQRLQRERAHVAGLRHQVDLANQQLALDRAAFQSNQAG